MCMMVLLVVNGQDPTPGFDWLYRHQFLPSEFVELEHETPHRANQRESRGDLGKIWVYHVPMVYPNTTEEKGPSVYPLSTSAMWGGGRRNMLTFSTGIRVSPKRDTGASKSKQNQGGAITYVYKRVASCKCPRSYFGV